jgi:hypothetical protein
LKIPERDAVISSARHPWEPPPFKEFTTDWGNGRVSL